MSSFLAGLLLLLLAVAQVTVAPRYPLEAATPDYLLVALTCWVLLRPREDAMVALPLGAVLLGLVGPQPVMLLVFVFAALLPLGMAVRAISPFGSLVNAVALLVLATFARDTVFALQAAADGATITPADFVLRAYLPGLALNLLMLPFFYLAVRLLGRRAAFSRMPARAY